jgi:hypothetical protein
MQGKGKREEERLRLLDFMELQIAASSMQTICSFTLSFPGEMSGFMDT